MKNNVAEHKKPEHFPVVAIGASAGGLEAISTFLEKVSPNLGIAYVIVQHLSPSHPSILPELLERKTVMPVRQVTDGMHLHPNSVYVIPPNAYMSVVDGKLTLSPRVKTDSGVHSIDHFLLALAPIYQNQAIAVIFSGTATDGTEGIRAIKAEGGITFAQDESAKFRGMPDNAIHSGHVDFILPPDKIAAELEKFVKMPYASYPTPEELATDEQDLRRIQTLLYQGWNVDFSSYKQTTITRRILRRMALSKIKSLREYTDMLVKTPEEAARLYKDLLINVTGFFRDPVVFDQLSKVIFPTMLNQRKPSEAIRIWVPACSSGEEVYSIAICLFEYFSQHSIVIPVQIFATDLSEGAIDRARTGIYSEAILERLSDERRSRFFVKINGNYEIIKPIRDICVFATHNLLKDPPFSKLDLISCQNVLIYIGTEGQKRILESFHYALKINGFLLLGKSETIGKASELFTPANKELKLFIKSPIVNYQYDFSARHPAGYQTTGSDTEKKPALHAIDSETDKEAETILLTRFVPASVTVNKDLLVLQFYGSTLRYLHPAAGKASFHLLKLVREDLMVDVRMLVHQAKETGIAVRKDGILLLDDEFKREISIEVIPIHSFLPNPHYLILFIETSPPPRMPSQPIPYRMKKTKMSRRSPFASGNWSRRCGLAETRSG